MFAAQQMPIVNEPTTPAGPNVNGAMLPGDCVDREGNPGIPYFATTTIRPGEELTVCYGYQYKYLLSNLAVSLNDVICCETAACESLAGQ